MDDSRREGTLAALNSINAGKAIEGNKVASCFESWGSGEKMSPPKV